jgi:hypothetical protein
VIVKKGKEKRRGGGRGLWKTVREVIFHATGNFCFLIFSFPERTREPVDIDTQTLLNSPTQNLRTFFFGPVGDPKWGRVQGSKGRRKRGKESSPFAWPRRRIAPFLKLE